MVSSKQRQIHEYLIKHSIQLFINRKPKLLGCMLMHKAFIFKKRILEEKHIADMLASLSIKIEVNLINQ
jgi:hypothetical protein